MEEYAWLRNNTQAIPVLGILKEYSKDKKFSFKTFQSVILYLIKMVS